MVMYHPIQVQLLMSLISVLSISLIRLLNPYLALNIHQRASWARGSTTQYSFLHLLFGVPILLTYLKAGKSIGPNSTSIENLKIFCPLTSSPMSQLINDSDQCGTFPDKMKLAKVIPLLKQGCAATKSN